MLTKRQEYYRAYARLNADKIKARMKIYAQANKEVLAAKSKIYYENNKDKLLARQRRIQHRRKYDRSFREARNAISHKYRIKNPERVLLNSAKERAKKFNYSFDLDLNWIQSKDMICELSGLKMIPKSGVAGRPKPRSPSIDRIDSSLGYTKDNCRLICWALNVAFQDWGAAEFALVARAWLSL